MSDTDVRAARDADARAAAAHQEYIAEVKQLVDQQFEALAAMVSAAATHAAGGHAAVTRHNHTLTVTGGDHDVVFSVAAVTHLSQGGDPAPGFPARPARRLLPV